MKAAVRVVTDPSEPPLIPMSLFTKPTAVVVRLYVLAGKGLFAMDTGMFAHGKAAASDPYICVELGSERIEDRDNYIKDATDADFYRCFELHLSLIHI